MSASDAAPLPRLGEVFFDVRGESRSMRLSWYADTGVAVFSIWQGGRCTGTFRLPIDDLPKMIDILQRGPQDRRRPPEPARPADYPAGEYGPAGDAGYGRDQDGPEDLPGYRGSRRRTESRERDYAPDGYYGETTGYEYPAATGRAGTADQGHGRDDGGYERYGQPGDGEERFVPPYVQGDLEAYPNDNVLPAARPPEAFGADSGEAGGYPLRSRPEPGYSGGSDYR